MTTSAPPASMAGRPSVFERLPPRLRHLRVIDWAFILYMVATAVLRIAFASKLPMGELVLSLVGRVAAIVGIAVVVDQAARTRHWGWRVLRDLYAAPLMGWLYIETASHNLFLLGHPLDEILERADQALFGFQPSLTFNDAFPQRWLGEALSFGYFSYYVIFAGLPAMLLLRRDPVYHRAYQRYLFVLAFVMVPCYVWYSVFAWWGPQYVFHDQYAREHFPGYVFKWALDFVLENGERPTGAFPSSHTALSAAVLVLLWRWSRPIAAVVLPAFTLLWFATVYIQAHFAVDVIVGLPLGLLMGWIAPMVQDRLRDPAMGDSILPPADDPVARVDRPLWGWRAGLEP